MIVKSKSGRAAGRSTTTVSVVIGIRDWEIFRLKMAVRSHQESTLGDAVEVVISDYGSENAAEVAQLAEALGCTYVFTDAPVWSRSAALNAGINVAAGDVIITTDADIIFAPRNHEYAVNVLKRFPNSLQLAQCYDLPKSAVIDPDAPFDWANLARIAKVRPRWGMGGLAAFTRKTCDRIRGYDERMVVWGAEDQDFAKRVRKSGGFINWIDDPEARIYHVWHPPFLQTHPDANAIFAANRQILEKDDTLIRNLTHAIYAPVDPLVSVVIATCNRANYLGQAIKSVLAQTFTDFELVIIDDGSEDNTQSVVEKIEDKRIRYHRMPHQSGVAAARNVGNRLARGEYIAVHDDDDLMVPDRLARQLAAIKEGVDGCFGGWIDFNETTDDMTPVPGRTTFNLSAVCFSSKVLLHPTLFVRRDVMLQLPYYEKFAAGSDYNLAFRMAWHGVNLVHCGDFVTLRRIHPSNMTALLTVEQKTSSLVTNSLYLNGLDATLERARRDVARDVPLMDITMSGREDYFAALQSMASSITVTPYSAETVADLLERDGADFSITAHVEDNHLQLKEIFGRGDLRAAAGESEKPGDDDVAPLTRIERSLLATECNGIGVPLILRLPNLPVSDPLVTGLAPNCNKLIFSHSKGGWRVITFENSPSRAKILKDWASIAFADTANTNTAAELEAAQ